MKDIGEEHKAHLIMKLRGQGIRSSEVLSAIESIPRDIFIENALKNFLSDPALTKSMGSAGRQLAIKRFCVKKVVDIHYSLYFVLLKS